MKQGDFHSGPWLSLRGRKIVYIMEIFTNVLDDWIHRCDNKDMSCDG